MGGSSLGCRTVRGGRDLPVLGVMETVHPLGLLAGCLEAAI
jgi:hypothetical protein